MKNIFILCIYFLPVIGFSQNKPAPKPISESQKIKNVIIKETKDNCALPKYYKTEQIKVNLVSKAGPIIIDVGFDKVLLPDTLNIAKFLFLSEDADDDKIKAGIGYPIKQITYEETQLGWNCIIEYIGPDLISELESIFVYKNKNDGTENTRFELFKSKIRKDTKKISESLYSVDYYYWAMSNGGNVRLYHKTGYASIDKKGIISYSLDKE